MKKFIAVILIVLIGGGWYMWLCRDISMSEIFNNIDVDYDACVKKANHIEIIIPSEAIGDKVEEYKEHDKIIEIIDTQDEIERFLAVCSECEGSIAKNKGIEFDYDSELQYAVYVYDDEELLFEFRLFGDWLAPGAPNTTDTYRLTNQDLDNFILDNYDEEPYRR